MHPIRNFTNTVLQALYESEKPDESETLEIAVIMFVPQKYREAVKLACILRLQEKDGQR